MTQRRDIETPAAVSAGQANEAISAALRIDDGILNGLVVDVGNDMSVEMNILEGKMGCFG